MEREIWFVDDDEIFRLVVTKLLEETPYSDRIRLFEDGDVALLELVTRSQTEGVMPALVFLDLGMKQLEGWQMVDLVNEMKVDINLVIVSSFDGPSNRQRAEQEHLVHEIIPKPLNTEAILGAIDRYASSAS